ncbi:MAG: WD40 repeat domain-containing protein [Planctomycetota bacterium]
MRIARALFALSLAAAVSRAEDPSALPEGALRRLGSPDGAHGSDIVDAAFTPDGKTIVSLDDDGGVRAWDVPSLRRRFDIDLEEVGIFLSISPDGSLFAVAQRNGVFLFALPGGKPSGRLYGPPPDLVAGTFSPDGKRFAAADDEGGLHQWMVETRSYDQGQLELLNGQDILGVTWSGDRIVAWDDEGQVTVLAGANLAEILTIQTDANDTNGGALSPDGKRLALGTDEGGVRVWNLESGEEADPLVPESSELASGISWSRDGGRLAWTNYQAELCVWSVPDQKVVARSPVRSEGRPVFSPDGAWLLSGIEGCRLVVLRADGATRASASEGHDGAVRALEFDSTGRTLWSAGADGNLWIWDVATGASRRIVENGAPISHIGVIDKGARFLLCTPQGGFSLWDASSGKRLKSSDDRMGFLTGGTWAPGAGTMFAMGQNGHGELWDAGLAGPILSVDVAVHPGAQAAMSPDGRLLAITSSSSLKIFATRTGLGEEPLSAFCTDQLVLAFSPDGSTLASADAVGTVLLTELGGGQVSVGRSQGNLLHLAFAGPAWLVAAGDHLHFMDLTRKEEDIPTIALPSMASALSVSRDGRFVATGFRDGTILIWKAPATDSSDEPAPDAAGLWDILGGESGPVREAILSCAAAGPEAVRALAAGLATPVPVPEGVRDLLPRLTSEQAEERDATEAALREAGPEAEPALREALHEASAEMRGRLEAILAACELPPRNSSALLRRSRAIRALERCGSAEALAVLRKISQSSPYARERSEAEGASKRLAVR